MDSREHVKLLYSIHPRVASLLRVGRYEVYPRDYLRMGTQETACQILVSVEDPQEQISETDVNNN